MGPISKYFGSDVPLFAEVNTQGYTHLGDQLSFQAHAFLSLVAESRRQGCSFSPAHLAEAVRDEFPEAFGNGSAGAAPAEPLELGAPASSFPARAAVNPSEKRHRRGIGNGKRGWSTRMRFYDTVLMEVFIALR